MQEVTTRRSIDEVLIDLNQTLRDERKYLMALDTASIEALNPKKSSLERELLAFSPEELLQRRPLLDTIRRQLQENLVLLVHAREQVQHRLGIEPSPIVGTRPSNPASAGTRLNLRG